MLHLFDLWKFILSNDHLQSCCQQLREATVASVVRVQESRRASAPNMRPGNQPCGFRRPPVWLSLRRSMKLSTVHSMIIKQPCTRQMLEDTTKNVFHILLKTIRCRRHDYVSHNTEDHTGV
jgi:hypothetical protein